MASKVQARRAHMNVRTLQGEQRAQIGRQTRCGPDCQANKGLLLQPVLHGPALLLTVLDKPSSYNIEALLRRLLLRYEGFMFFSTPSRVDRVAPH
eukprot:scaffold199158_cov24-Tisochrysis_lutea.AAC.1